MFHVFFERVNRIENIPPHGNETIGQGAHLESFCQNISPDAASGTIPKNEKSVLKKKNISVIL